MFLSKATESLFNCLRLCHHHVPKIKSLPIFFRNKSTIQNFTIFSQSPPVSLVSLISSTKKLEENRLELGGVRSHIMYSMLNGKRKTVKAVTNRFYRLDWGAWIRPKAGRYRHFYRKNKNMQRSALQHVFCKGTQNTLFDKMVSKCWREKKFYVDDCYETYQIRNNYAPTRKLIRTKIC